jgi:hypothetical protein
MKESHHQFCTCRWCRVNHYGKWIYNLGKMTPAGRWQVFGTITFRPTIAVWGAGFPWSKNTNPDFAHRLFQRLILFIENGIQSRVDFVCADQLGFISGKFHQHFLLSASGLERYPRQLISNWLLSRAGFSPVFPARRGAERYIGRFIAENPESAHWDFRIGNTAVATEPQVVGRQQVAPSAELSRSHFYTNHRRY